MKLPGCLDKRGASAGQLRSGGGVWCHTATGPGPANKWRSPLSTSTTLTTNTSRAYKRHSLQNQQSVYCKTEQRMAKWWLQIESMIYITAINITCWYTRTLLVRGAIRSFNTASYRSHSLYGGVKGRSGWVINTTFDWQRLWWKYNAYVRWQNMQTASRSVTRIARVAGGGWGLFMVISTLGWHTADKNCVQQQLGDSRHTPGPALSKHIK